MKIQKLLALTAVLAMSGTACANLDVQNLNAPDRERAISSPQDVENLIAGGFDAWWDAQHKNFPATALSVAADSHSSSWGNWGMRDSGWEPRKAYDNDPAYGNNNMAETPWGNNYAALAGVRDGLVAICGEESGGCTNSSDWLLTIDDPPGCTQAGLSDCTDLTDRAVAFGHFTQAVAFSALAILFDQGFIVDEDTNLETADFVPATEVFQAALDKYAAAISESQGKSWTIPVRWIGQEDGADWSSARFVSVMKAFRARFRTQMARTPEQRAAVDWAAVKADVQNPLVGGDFWGYYDGNTNWWGRDKLHGCCVAGWARLDYRTAGPADGSGEWENWINTEASQRQPFDIVTNDIRITEAGDPQEDGTLVDYLGSSPFPADRGTYHFSNYLWDGWELDEASGSYGRYTDMTDLELRFMEAEADCRPNYATGACSGSNASMLQLVNDMRAEGGLNPFTTTSNPDAAPMCVPKDLDGDGSCGNLWEAYKYEKRIMLFHYGGWTEFMDDRGWGDLVQDTWQQLPVPGSELLLLLQDIYTFGGPGGEFSAPNLINDFSTDALRIKREALERFREATEEQIQPEIRR